MAEHVGATDETNTVSLSRSVDRAGKLKSRCPPDEAAVGGTLLDHLGSLRACTAV